MISKEKETWISIAMLLAGGLEHFLFFPYIGNNHPNWLIFFRGVETTNQVMLVCWRVNGSWTRQIPIHFLGLNMGLSVNVVYSKIINNLTGTFIKLWSWGYVIFTQTDIFRMRN